MSVRPYKEVNIGLDDSLIGMVFRISLNYKLH